MIWKKTGELILGIKELNKDGVGKQGEEGLGDGLAKTKDNEKAHGS